MVINEQQSVNVLLYNKSTNILILSIHELKIFHPALHQRGLPARSCYFLTYLYSYPY